MRYELYYWPGLPGRGEYVRLALEEAGAPYWDVAQSGEDADAIARQVADILDNGDLSPPCFAPPVLKAGRFVICQTANILQYLGTEHGLSPGDYRARLWTHQLQLTIADLVDEIHNTHHPLGPYLYYEEQKEEAAKAAKTFLDKRLPKYLGYFNRVLDSNPDSDHFLSGSELSYADLSLFHTVEGLRYAFPRAMAEEQEHDPLVMGLHRHVAALPRIKAYMGSDRRQPFNESGVFRHYPELDR